MLGVNVQQIRLIVLLIATLAVSGVISMTGLISFVFFWHHTEHVYY